MNLPSEKAEAAVLHDAQCLAQLSHPNVVACYETGNIGDDLFISMDRAYPFGVTPKST